MVINPSHSHLFKPSKAWSWIDRTYTDINETSTDQALSVALTSHYPISDPATLTDFPTVDFQPSSTTTKTTVPGLDPELTYIQIGQDVLNYSQEWYCLVTLEQKVYLLQDQQNMLKEKDEAKHQLLETKDVQTNGLDNVPIEELPEGHPDAVHAQLLKSIIITALEVPGEGGTEDNFVIEHPLFTQDLLRPKYVAMELQKTSAWPSHLDETTAAAILQVMTTLFHNDVLQAIQEGTLTAANLLELAKPQLPKLLSPSPSVFFNEELIVDSSPPN
ncbi:hypothetical protein BS47DRAFT_1356922 [Hydnum rufescens UP504]|uniref:Uncharacterized protein n=1 Tax=Hydnum rufescens UP504 TaxID=1448309 RepID=A0A9P6BDL6_9AGAM|nr:hypothetical protein BS47DRAFT_1356922 [Hydnum rufescens UP504]